jgi:hypothetical protein
LNNLAVMAKFYTLPDVDFVIPFSDAIYSEKWDPYPNVFDETPIIMMSKNLDNKCEINAFLIPDAFIL